jgi:hypothetical protein
MSSSYVEFRGQGFEADDSTLEVWLLLLVKEIELSDPIPSWLQDVHDEWLEQATAGFGFGISPGLDRFITNEERVSTVLKLCEGAMARLSRYGEKVPQVELNAMHTGDGAVFTRDVPTEMFLNVGRYFVKLLQGTLRPNEKDARTWIAAGNK